MQPFLSILVVCLNAGDKLRLTLESIAGQTFRDYEVLVKDGLSTDGSGETAASFEKAFPAFRLIRQADTGIYDAMNQAVRQAGGRFVYFLNCGDRFYSETVLEEMAAFLKTELKGREKPLIGYGNIFERLTGQPVTSNPHMDAFGCYRNVPCHQACFYERELLLCHPFETGYRVRADYEQFLWCFFEAGAACCYKEMLIADYEGGGFSETKENRRTSKKEHGEITRKYMSAGERFRFRLIMLLTLAKLRTWIAGNEKTAGIYNGVKKRLYSLRRN